MSIVSSFKNINVANALAKTAGLAGLGYVLVDSHLAAKVEAEKTQKDIKSDSIEKHYLSDMKLENHSIVQSKIKKKVTDFYMNENISDPFTRTAGYVKGFGSMLVNNIVPLGLSVGALVSPKGIFSKMFGVGLLAYGGIFLAQEFLGIGQHTA